MSADWPNPKKLYGREKHPVTDLRARVPVENPRPRTPELPLPPTIPVLTLGGVETGLASAGLTIVGVFYGLNVLLVVAVAVIHMTEVECIICGLFEYYDSVFD